MMQQRFTCGCAPHDFKTQEISIGCGVVALPMQRLGFSMLVRFRSVLRFRFCSICSCLRVIDKGCARCAGGMILMCFLINFEAIHAIDDFQNYSICFRGQLKNAKSAFRVRRRDRIDARTLRQSSHTHTRKNDWRTNTLTKPFSSKRWFNKKCAEILFPDRFRSLVSTYYISSTRQVKFFSLLCQFCKSGGWRFLGA